MKTYTKSYDHLNADISVNENVTVEPTPMPEPAPVRIIPTPRPNLKSSNIPKVIIILLIVVIAYLGYTLIPSTFEECERFPGSKLTLSNEDVCSTFYGIKFSKANLAAGNMPLLTPTPRPTSIPTKDDYYIPELATSAATTKGGLPIINTPTPTKKAAVATQNTQTQPIKQTIIPTPTLPSSAPFDYASDWIKHRYPDQHLSFYLPKGWLGSVATRNLDTGITTLNLGGTESLNVTIQPNWNNTANAKDQAINYGIGGLSAIKVTGNSTTSVYVERNGQVYIFTCHNSLWNTCDTILHSITFIN